MTRNDRSDEERATVLEILETARDELEAELVGGAAPSSAALPIPTKPLSADDAGVLAVELAGSFAQMVHSYREHYKLSPEEAQQRAVDMPDAYLAGVFGSPPDQVSWFDLDALAQRDPEKALARWEEVKQAAREEIRGGHRSARALEDLSDTCWERARFLAVRAELTEAVRPRSALEQQLVDQLAQWQTLLWRWQETLTAYTFLAARGSKKSVQLGQSWEPLRLSEDEALERATEMVERLHRLYSRTLRALQDQRRSPAVVVRHAGQVNLGQQQVNVQPR